MRQQLEAAPPRWGGARARGPGNLAKPPSGGLCSLCVHAADPGPPLGPAQSRSAGPPLSLRERLARPPPGPSMMATTATFLPPKKSAPAWPRPTRSLFPDAPRYKELKLNALYFELGENSFMKEVVASKVRGLWRSVLLGVCLGRVAGVVAFGLGRLLPVCGDCVVSGPPRRRARARKQRVVCSRVNAAQPAACRRWVQTEPPAPAAGPGARSWPRRAWSPRWRATWRSA